MRIMGLDLGDKTIGVAVSDETKLIAQGYATIRRKGLANDLDNLAEIIKEKQINKIVLGLPKNMNNTIGERGNKSIEFAETLKNHLNDMEIVLWDERLTTVSAERVLLEADVKRKRRKNHIDMIAAVFILQSYLDLQNKNN
ncbi:MAG: Holliday junction resolvase RuvX [Clostridiales bacterium]|nr:Holliday junction resolvase RuvX [Clostridiales bacterium]